MSPAEAAIREALIDTYDDMIREALIDTYDDMQWAYSNEDQKVIAMHERGYEAGREPFVSSCPALLSELDALREEVFRLRSAGEKLQAALSRIDYLCGPPNEMGISNYDCFFEEDEVVKAVERLRARCEAAEKLLKELAKCECYGWEETLYERIDAHLKKAGHE